MGVVRTELWRSLASRRERTGRVKDLDALWMRGVGGLRALAHTSARYLREAERALELESAFGAMSAAQLRAEVDDLRRVFALGRTDDGHVARAVVLAREAAFRELGVRAHAEQVAAALALARGCVVEMATGEGKTLAAALAGVGEGWRGRGAHVLTANDYLARRDAEWMAPLYAACGLRAASIGGDSSPEERRAAYAADVTYLTSRDAAGDFLKDRLLLGGVRTSARAALESLTGGPGARGLDAMVGRGLASAIVDEADSLLIDEAATPLIISGAGGRDEGEAHAQAEELARGLETGRDYRVDRGRREIELTSEGRSRLRALAAGLGGVWSGARRSEELVTLALQARELFERGVQYVVDEGRVVIVDEATGRLQPDRSWRDGLHQAVEAKEGLEVRSTRETLARISFQRFFRLYPRLGGATGTAREEAGELWLVYRTPVVTLPTHRPCLRALPPDRVFAKEAAKLAAVVAETRALRDAGRPVLIGVRTVEQSERLSGLLQAQGVEHAVLNARRHREEALVVARAGERGRVTIATNMAGRGTDIALGPGVAEAGGLAVIATERHDSRRVDRQLFGRSARQGDPGSAQAFVSLEDELVRRFAPGLASAARARSGTGEEMRSALARTAFETAQRRAQARARRQRAAVLRSDDWLDEALGFAGSQA